MSARIIPSLAPPPLFHQQYRYSHSVKVAKNACIYFQQLAHSSQFTMRCIHLIFSSLRTLCQKHPGVVLVLVLKSFGSPTTQIESTRYAKITLISFRMKTIHRHPGVGYPSPPKFPPPFCWWTTDRRCSSFPTGPAICRRQS